MKSFLKRGTAIIVMAGLYACANEDKDQPIPQANPSSVQFEQNLTISEATTEGYIMVKLDKPNPKASILKIEVSNPAGVPFETVPAMNNNEIELIIEQGASSKQIVFKPSNDQEVSPDRNIGFTILSATNGLLLGSKQSIAVIIAEDDEVSNEPTKVSFEHLEGLVEENQTGSFKLVFSEAAKTSGTIVLNSEQLLSSQTISVDPALKADGSLELPFQAGQTEISFHISVADDLLFNKHDQLQFNIETLSEGFISGDITAMGLKIIDNELKGMPASYVSQGGGWLSRKTFEYDQQGRISKVHWEQGQNYGNPLTGTETYTYATNGLIEKINEYPGIDVLFIQQNGRIARSEKIRHGELRSYKIYDYDQAGNVAGYVEYNKIADGSFVQSLIHLFLYYQNHSLYLHQIYSPSPDGQEPVLISEKYYENYLEAVNPFSAIEVIPTINAQRNLPGSYTFKREGLELFYQMTYEFNDEGQVIRRTATSSTGSEGVVYSYY